MQTQQSELHGTKSSNCVCEYGDDVFYVEWEDVFMIPVDYQRRTPIRMEAPKRLWRGAEWNILFYMRAGCINDFGLFIGFNEPNKLPSDWSFSMLFQFSLVGLNGEDIASSAAVRNKFFAAGNERNDHGHFASFSSKIVGQLLNQLAVAGKGQKNDATGIMKVPVRIRFRAEEVFFPVTLAKLPVPYNSKRMTGMVGLENLGATCYLNALLQMLYHINDFRRAVYKLPHDAELMSTSTTLALQHLFKNLQYSDKEVSPKELIIAFGWSSADTFLQQDVQEMLRVLIDKLEEKMRGTVVEDYTKRLFAGKSRSFIKCVNVEYESKRVEDFYDIQLDVKGCKNIYDSFKKYTDIEMLDGENQYEAGEHGKQDARKGVIFEEFPPVLTIHLKRFDFDLNTFHFYKINDHYEFPERLELDQFLAEDCPSESRQKKNVYILHSVLVHMGDAGSGHYYAYIRPTTKQYTYGSKFTAEGSDEMNETDENNTSNENNGQTNALVATSDEQDTMRAGSPAVLEEKNVDMAAGDDSIGPRNLLSSLQDSEASSEEIKSACKPKQLGEGTDDDQWYKFNDEIVHKVTRREAIDHCYGRRILEDTYRSIASAYMVVYIRECDAPQIMREVLPSEIPRDLFDRFQNELSAQRAEQMREKRNGQLCPVMYATENELRKFQEYTRIQDLINEKSMKHFHVMVDSTRLGLHLAIAKEIKRSPIHFRLWEIEKNCVQMKGSSNTFRVIEDWQLEDLKFPLKHNRFFVQCFDPDLDDDDLSHFLAFYRAALQEEEKLLTDLRIKLFNVPDLYYTDQDDPVYGMGIGTGMEPLEELKDYDMEAYTYFHNEFTRLKDQMYFQLKDFGDDLNPNCQMVFVKAFDPYDVLPQLTAINAIVGEAIADQSSSSVFDEDENIEEEIVGGYPFGWDDSLNAGNIKQGTSAPSSNSFVNTVTAESKEEGDAPLCEVKMDVCSTLENQQSKESSAAEDAKIAKKSIYMPAKYVGNIVIPQNSFLTDLSKSIKNLLDTYGHQPYPDGSATNTYSDDYDPVESLQLYLSTSPIRVEKLPSPDVLYRNRVNTYITETNSLVYVDLVNIANKGMQWKAVSDCTDAASWLRYQATKKKVSIRPFGQRDVVALRKVYRAAELYNAKQLLQASSDENGLSDEADGFIHAAVRRKVSKSEELHDGGASPSPILSGRENELQYIEPPPVVRKSFTIEITTLIEMPKVFARVADELRINPYHLVLFLVENTNNVEDMLSQVMQVKPLTLVMQQTTTLQDVISNQRLHNKPSTRYCLFFRLLPYKLYPDRLSVITDVLDIYRHKSNHHTGSQSIESLTLAEQTSVKQSKKFSDFIICDARLRKWRRLFRKHLHKTDALYNLESVEKVIRSQILSRGEGNRYVTERDGEVNVDNGVLGFKRRISDKSSADTSTEEMGVGVIDSDTTIYNGHNIQWPSSDGIPLLDVVEANVVYTCVTPSTHMSYVCDLLRAAIGLPLNIGELIASDGYTIDTMDPAVKEILEDKEAADKLFCGDCAVVTDRLCLRTAENKENGRSDVGYNPSVPLVVTCMRYDVINEIFFSNSSAQSMPQCWSDCTVQQCHLFTMGVQFVTPEDALFMQGRHPTIRSVIVVVSNFTFFGNSVQLCDCRLFSGGFVSYVREDDDYFSLTKRFGIITGEQEFDKYRLAVLDSNKIPSFISRPAIPTTAATADQITSANEAAVPKKSSIWELLLSRNPHYAEGSTDLTTKQLDRLKNRHLTPYPHISIQRSSSEIPFNSRFKRFENQGGIKIV